MFTQEDCKLAIINRESYLEVVRKKEGKDIKSRIAFVRSIPFFKHLYNFKLVQVLKLMKEVTYVRNQQVYVQGEQPSHLYIVVDGEFEGVWASKSQYHKINLNHQNKLENARNFSKEELFQFLDQRKHVDGCPGPGTIGCVCNQVKKADKVSNNLYFGERGAHQKKSVFLANQGQLIGAEDLILDKPNSFSLLCRSQQGTLLQFGRDEFLNYLQNIDEKFLNKYTQDIKERNEQISKRILFLKRSQKMKLK